MIAKKWDVLCDMFDMFAIKLRSRISGREEKKKDEERKTEPFLKLILTLQFFSTLDNVQGRKDMAYQSTKRTQTEKQCCPPVSIKRTERGKWEKEGNTKIK